MNIALWSKERKEYYIASVKEHSNEPGRFVACGKRISEDGHLIERGMSFDFDSEQNARVRCRGLAKMKKRKKGMVDVPLDKLTTAVQVHLAVPSDMQVSPQEMVLIILNAKSERYVTLKSVSGIEEQFDTNIEYLGFDVDEENDVVKVYDRFGVLREVFRDRIATIKPTERALEVTK